MITKQEAMDIVEKHLEEENATEGYCSHSPKSIWSYRSDNSNTSVSDTNALSDATTLSYPNYRLNSVVLRPLGEMLMRQSRDASYKIRVAAVSVGISIVTIFLIIYGRVSFRINASLENPDKLPSIIADVIPGSRIMFVESGVSRQDICVYFDSQIYPELLNPKAFRYSLVVNGLPNSSARTGMWSDMISIERPGLCWNALLHIGNNLLEFSITVQDTKYTHAWVTLVTQ